jgi:putative addiction module CopG family antidote
MDMEINIRPEDQERIKRIVETGKYPDERAVIHAALMALKEREERKRLMREAVVQKAESDESADRD